MREGMGNYKFPHQLLWKWGDVEI